MTGTTGDIIPIIIVPVLALVFCLVMVYYADSHPRWGSQAPADTVSTYPLEGNAPAQRLSGPGPKPAPDLAVLRQDLDDAGLASLDVRVSLVTLSYQPVPK